MQTFILAGGFATRLWPLTEKRAKPLLPLAGKPIITHLVEKIPPGLPITVSTNAAFAEQFEAWLGSIDRPAVSIVVEETKSDDEKLGALGAVAQWIEFKGINEDVLLLTGDNYCGFSIEEFLKAYQAGTPLLAAHDIGDLERTKIFGTVILEEPPIRNTKNEIRNTKVIAAFEEKPKDSKTTLVSTGVSVIPKDQLPILVAFAAEHPDHVGGIFEEFLRSGIPIHCFQFSEPWFDIGSFDAYLEATRTLVGENTLKEQSASMANAHCAGSVVIGKGSTVKDCTLTNVVLFEDCTLEDCVLESCIIDNGCQLKGIDLQGKMLREGTELRREQ